MKEIRRDIKWYEWKYMVSNLWSVKSLSRLIHHNKHDFISKERILKKNIGITVL